jgi:hypothetical protein
MLRQKVLTQRNALSPTLQPTEPSKEEEELSELMVESLPISQQTVILNSSSLKRLRALRRVMKTRTRPD